MCVVVVVAVSTINNSGHVILDSLTFSQAVPVPLIRPTPVDQKQKRLAHEQQRQHGVHIIIISALDSAISRLLAQLTVSIFFDRGQHSFDVSTMTPPPRQTIDFIYLFKRI